MTPAEILKQANEANLEWTELRVKREKDRPEDVLSPIDRALMHSFGSIRQDHLILPCHQRGVGARVEDGGSYCDGDWHHTRRFFAVSKAWNWAPFERCPIAVMVAAIMRESEGATDPFATEGTAETQ